MAVGDMTVTVVGTYNTVALLVVAMDAANLPATTDQLIILQTGGASGQPLYTLLKSVRATA